MKIQILLALATFACCQCAPTIAPTQAAGTTQASLKDLILKRVAEVDARIKSEVKKLTDSKREHLAGELLEEQERVDKVANELKTTEPGPEALRLLEEEIIFIERRVAEEVRFIESLSDETTKTEEQLLDRAVKLRHWAEQEIENLRKEGGHERVIEVLNRQVAEIEHISVDLVKVHTKHELQRTEIELRRIETRVFEELRHLTPRPTPTPSQAPESTTPGTGTTSKHHATKEELEARAVVLENHLAEDISKLKGDETLKKEREFLEGELVGLKMLAKELINARDPKTIEELEIKLTALEARVAETLKKVDEQLKGRTTAKPNDIKEDLLKKAQELETKGEAEVKKLTDEGKKHESEELEKELTALKKVAKDVEDETDPEKLKHLEGELARLEKRIDELILRDEHTRPTGEPTRPPRTTTA